MSNFQSYLVVGDNFDVIRKKTTQLANNYGINLNLSSPDLSFVKPTKNFVSIDSVRDLKKHIFQKPLSGKFKFVIIEQAHKLTLEAQNALLKILEEPPVHAIIILESANKQALLETITSRVLTIKTKGSPPLYTESLILGRNPLKVLEEFARVENIEDFLDSQIVTLTKMLKENINGKKSQFSNQSLASAIEKCASAKEMIAANVNPKFTLANLILSLNLASK